MHSNGTSNGTNGYANGNGVTYATFPGVASFSHEALPHSEDAELALLGSLVIDPDAFIEVDAIVEAADFYSKERGQVYQAIADLSRNRQPVDVLTLGNALTAKGITSINNIDSDIFVIGLINIVPTAINVKAYASIVESMALRRRLIQAGNKIGSMAQSGETAVDELVKNAEAALFGVTSKSATHNVHHIKDVLSEFYERVTARQERKEPPGMSTGFHAIDNIIGGLRGGRTYIIAARPGMGKSVLENNMSAHITKRGKRAVKFNLEMGNDSIIQRQLSAYTGIPYQKIENGTMDAAEFARFTRAVGELSTLNIWMDDSSNLTLSQLRAKATRLYMENGLDLLTVDYLTLMQADSRAGTRTEDIGSLSRGLHSLAKDLNIPIIILAQLSRSCEARSDKRPLLADLRDSGEIEQDADVVMFIYRDDYYNADTSQRPNVAEVNVAKNRHGKTGIAELYFNGPLMRFNDLERGTIQL